MVLPFVIYTSKVFTGVKTCAVVACVLDERSFVRKLRVDFSSERLFFEPFTSVPPHHHHVAVAHARCERGLVGDFMFPSTPVFAGAAGIHD